MNRETVNAEKYSLLQLKAWCAAVAVNASGAKASSAARLSELSVEARGSCPVDKAGEKSVLDGGDDENTGNAAQQQRGKSVSRNNDEHNVENNGENNEENNGGNNGVNNVENDGPNNGQNNGPSNNQDNGPSNGQHNGEENIENSYGTDDDDGAVYVRNVLSCTHSGTFGHRLSEYSSSDGRASNNGETAQPIPDSVEQVT
ncbi:PREDICTED: putative uncharacterized protein DDB_G0283051 [Rhagoletis zephyria]|uniref:putative uncharacterized protein DDB_G0283051 n=1 Tax=Rhagoletis zephyria TaxID=28612 RepID=UPI0008112443|nr:PREDICTED: putative uncharacterized protein DDB_G0283051 [Rhagoletis zephyria]